MLIHILALSPLFGAPLAMPASASTSHITAPPSSTASRSSTASVSAKRSSSTTQSESILSTETQGGIVYGCTSLGTVSTGFEVTVNGAVTSYVAGQLACDGGPTLSTITSLLIPSPTPPSNTWPSAPATGCAIITPKATPSSITNNNDPYCTCANGEMEGVEYAVSSGNYAQSTSYCESTPKPTGYFSVPIPGDASWTEEPSSDCASASLTTNTSCWAELHLADYVTWWWETFNSTCGSTLFANCFYGEATKYGAATCDVITSVSGCKQPSWNDFNGTWNGIRNFYVAQNIWNLNGFFVEYWNALDGAAQGASGKLGEIISIINPPKLNQNKGLDIFLSVLSLGITLIPGGGFLAGRALNDVGKSLVSAASNSANLARWVFPSGSLNSQIEDWDEISSSMTTVYETMQSSIDKALSLIQSNITDFIAMGNTRIYSGVIETLPDLTQQILHPLLTYEASLAFQMQGIIITRTLDTDVHALMTNGTSLNWKLDCTTGYDENGICGTFWYDSRTSITYALEDENSPTTNFNSIMTQLVTAGILLDLLFAGSDQCAKASGSTQGGAPALADISGTDTPSCIANMKVCTWSLTPQTVAQWQSLGFAPSIFTDCTPSWKNGGVLGRIGEDGCVGSDAGVDVPMGYVGWGILNNDAYKNSADGFCLASKTN